MKQFRFNPSHHRRATIDITSLIDLVFLLVVFFMVTSSLGRISSISVNLPRADQSGSGTQAEHVISINEKNEIFINDVPSGMISERRSGAGSGIAQGRSFSGRPSIPVQAIVKVMDGLNQAGISKFSLSTVKNR
jgi:biopolymer transport protein ExbD